MLCSHMIISFLFYLFGIYIFQMSKIKMKLSSRNVLKIWMVKVLKNH